MSEGRMLKTVQLSAESGRQGCSTQQMQGSARSLHEGTAGTSTVVDGGEALSVWRIDRVENAHKTRKKHSMCDVSGGHEPVPYLYSYAGSRISP